MTEIDFGPAHDGEDAARAVIAYLQEWLPLYTVVVERLKGDAPGSHPPVRTWTIKNDFADFPEENLPIVLAVAVGTQGKPTKDGTGRWRAPYGIGMVVIASGQDRDNGAHNASIYNLAIRLALLQHQSLNVDFIRAIDFAGEAYDRIDVTKERTLSAVRSAYIVDVRNIATASAGPGVFLTEPPADPVAYVGELPTLQNIKINVQSEGDGP